VVPTFWSVNLEVPGIIVKIIHICFQQDATLHSLFISGKPLYMFQAVSPPIIRNYTKLYLQHLVLVKPLLLPAAIVEKLGLVQSQFFHDSGR
jgi:hypothetical protein